MVKSFFLILTQTTHSTDFTISQWRMIVQVVVKVFKKSNSVSYNFSFWFCFFSSLIWFRCRVRCSGMIIFLLVRPIELYLAALLSSVGQLLLLIPDWEPRQLRLRLYWDPWWHGRISANDRLLLRLQDAWGYQEHLQPSLRQVCLGRIGPESWVCSHFYERSVIN